MTYIKLALLSLWFVLCSAIVIWFGVSSKNQFDPELKLAQSIMDLGFEQSLVEILPTRASMPMSNSKSGRIFHINQGDCYCEWLAEPHQRKLDQWGEKHSFSTQYVDIEKLDALKALIPSTPAIIALDENDHLIYLGPYSRGSGCFGTNGMIDEQLALYLDKVQFLPKSPSVLADNINLSTVIETEASGCYCSV